MKIRKTLAVGIAAASITAGVAAPAQAQAQAPAPQSSLSQQGGAPKSANPIAGSLNGVPLLLAVPIMIPWLAFYAIWVALHPGQG